MLSSEPCLPQELAFVPAGCEHTFGEQGIDVTAKFGHPLELHVAPWKDPRVKLSRIESSQSVVVMPDAHQSLCKRMWVKQCSQRVDLIFFLLKAKECEFEKSHVNLVTLPSYDFSRE